MAAGLSLMLLPVTCEEFQVPLKGTSAAGTSQRCSASLVADKSPPTPALLSFPHCVGCPWPSICTTDQASWTCDFDRLGWLFWKVLFGVSVGGSCKRWRDKQLFLLLCATVRAKFILSWKSSRMECHLHLQQAANTCDPHLLNDKKQQGSNSVWLSGSF